MSIELDRTIYESSHPDVLAAWARWVKDCKAWHDRCNRAIRKVGFSTRHVSAVYDDGRWGTRFMVGVRARTDWRSGVPATPLPDHWRVERKHGGFWTPRLSGPHKAEGQKAAEIIGRVRMDDIRHYLPGQPQHVGFFSRCGIAADPDESEAPERLIVTWGVGPDAVDGEVDDDLWRQIPLSEWYARLEEAS